MMKRRGQVALYLLMVLVAVFLLTLLNVDSFIAVRGKNRVQNAGDAAALAAATRQGELLNEIGRLNLEHLRAAAEDDREQCDEIVETQRRLALLGPVDALRRANEAAKRNRMETHDEFAAILREHAAIVRTVYSGGGGAGDPYPEPWPGAWLEYAGEIENVIAEGLATGPDNCEFYGAAGGHLLLTKDFYHAIAGVNWCWFHFNCEELLSSYSGYHDWSPLPERNRNALGNSEIFSLHVSARQLAISDVFSPEKIAALLGEEGNAATLAELERSTIITNETETWFFYDPTWGRWFNGLSLADEEDGWQFPIVGEVKPEYNVRGCAAICRCVKDYESIATDTSTLLNWAAAAKPFGTLEGEDGVATVTSESNFVLPGFEATRLVALDSVGGEDLSTADYGWVHHVRHHLEDYLKYGPKPSDCFYCQQLVTWELRGFRQTGVTWLRHYADTCIRPTGGGSAHGGTSHGH